MAAKISDSEWNARHHEMASNLFRQQLAHAIETHTPMLGDPGFLSKDELIAHLIAACGMLQMTDDADLRAISSPSILGSTSRSGPA